MKKSLVLALVVSFVLSVAGTAFAFPVDFTGDFKYEFRQNKDYLQGTHNENRFYTDLKFNGKIDDKNTFFARFAGQVKDRQSAPGGDSETNGFTLDQFGVKTVTGDWTFALGRQGAQLGQGGIFYAGSDIDPMTYFDGVVATTKMGDFDVKIIGGKSVRNTETYNAPSSLVSFSNYSQDWAGIDFKVPVDKVTLGFAYAKSSLLPEATGYGGKYWDLNFATKIGAVDFSGEYVKSDANRASGAYTFAGTYAWDVDNFTIAYNNVKGFGVDPVSSNIGTIYYPNGNDFFNGDAFGYKGFTYAYHHSITKAWGFNAYYLSLQPLEGTNKGHLNNELGINLKWSF